MQYKTTNKIEESNIGDLFLNLQFLFKHTKLDSIKTWKIEPIVSIIGMRDGERNMSIFAGIANQIKFGIIITKKRSSA